mmetsp:Transcript_32404/g.104858  ORF Transcript_32404/g.104858 Transcript_32404/m.104858 type:complete len:200 (+) Transcript_32404:720-1319(+)
MARGATASRATARAAAAARRAEDRPRRGSSLPCRRVLVGGRCSCSGSSRPATTRARRWCGGTGPSSPRRSRRRSAYTRSGAAWCQSWRSSRTAPPSTGRSPRRFAAPPSLRPTSPPSPSPSVRAWRSAWTWGCARRSRSAASTASLSCGSTTWKLTPSSRGSPPATRTTHPARTRRPRPCRKPRRRRRCCRGCCPPSPS